MKVVFALGELAEEIENAAGRLYEEKGGTLGDNWLTLSSINTGTQELLFTVDGLKTAETIDMSPVVTDDGYAEGNDPALDDVNPDA
jgi:hypothetical protein